jgi:glycerate-2-kinase
MATTATMATMIKMLESLPEQVQERVMEHLREYIEEIKDEADWNKSFAQSQNKLVAAAKQARKDVQNGKSEPMNLKKL